MRVACTLDFYCCKNHKAREQLPHIEQGMSMNIFKKLFSKKKKVAVISIDGVPYTLARKMMNDGNFPNFARMIESGGFAQMRSTIPFVSIVAWSSFMTGKNPGKHGIYGFVEREPGTYKAYLPNHNSLKTTTLWEYLSENKKRLVSINVPPTYPPRPVNGVMITGFLTPKLEKGVYPQSIYPILKEIGYRIDTDPWQARRDKDKFIEDLHFTLSNRVEAMNYFWENEDWDFFMCHIMGTDRIQHFLWEQWEDGHERYASEFVRYFERIDEILRQFYDKADENTHFIVLSDHGFCRVKREVNLNYWLQQIGLFKPAEKGADPLSIPAGTPVYSMPPGRIYLNLEGREPDGIIDPNSADGLIQEISDRLMNLKAPGTGEPIIKQVYKKDEIYKGDQTRYAPDIVAMAHDGYDLKGGMNKATLTDKTELVGMHTYDDALVYIKNHEIEKSDPEIIDLMPTILKLLGLKLPNELDGRSLIS